MIQNKLKIVTVVGTRPEIIRLSCTMTLLDKYVNQIIIHTGQNYDYELNEVFWKDLKLRKPDYFMEIDTSSLGASLGDIFRKSEELLKKINPDGFLVLGDTNSCLSAYMAKRLHIPVFHMEAGNRCFDPNVPEETNRKIIDHIADFNLVYTEHARRHLISEGIPQRRIYLTGSPMHEVLKNYLPDIDRSGIINSMGLKARGYFLISTHREENVDNPENLKLILNLLESLVKQYNLPVIVSTHPRTRKRIEQLDNFQCNKYIQFLKPFGFLDYVHLEMNALCTLSDSGTISEESAIMGFPAISLRQSMERPEAQDTGSIILTGFDTSTILQSVALSISETTERKISSIPSDYLIEDTSWRVLKLILGNCRLSNIWSGIKSR